MKSSFGKPWFGKPLFRSETADERGARYLAEAEKEYATSKSKSNTNYQTSAQQKESIKSIVAKEKTAYTLSGKYQKAKAAFNEAKAKHNTSRSNINIARKYQNLSAKFKVEENKVHQYLANRLANIGIPLTAKEGTYKYLNIVSNKKATYGTRNNHMGKTQLSATTNASLNDLKERERLLRHVRKDYLNAVTNKQNEKGLDILSKVEASLRLKILLKRISLKKDILKIKEEPIGDTKFGKTSIENMLYDPTSATQEAPYLTIENLLKEVRNVHDLLKMVTYEKSYIAKKISDAAKVGFGLMPAQKSAAATAAAAAASQTFATKLWKPYNDLLTLLETMYKEHLKLIVNLLNNKIVFLCNLFKAFGTHVVNMTAGGAKISLFKLITRASNATNGSHTNATNKALYSNTVPDADSNITMKNQTEVNTLLANDQDYAKIRFIFTMLLIEFGKFYSNQGYNPSKTANSMKNPTNRHSAHQEPLIDPTIIATTDIQNIKNTLKSCNISETLSIYMNVNKLRVAANAMYQFNALLNGCTAASTVNMYGRNSATPITNKVMNSSTLVDALKDLVTAAVTAAKTKITDDPMIKSYTDARTAFITAYTTTDISNPLNKTGNNSCGARGLFTPQCLEKRGNLARKAKRGKGLIRRDGKITQNNFNSIYKRATLENIDDIINNKIAN